jgi:hypothetical protein
MFRAEDEYKSKAIHVTFLELLQICFVVISAGLKLQTCCYAERKFVNHDIVDFSQRSFCSMMMMPYENMIFAIVIFCLAMIFLGALLITRVACQCSSCGVPGGKFLYQFEYGHEPTNSSNIKGHHCFVFLHQTSNLFLIW